MNSAFNYFYQDNKDCFVLKEDFIRAYSCIDYYWDSDTEEDVNNRKKLFKKDFLDKFEFGASFMALSY